MPSTPLTSSASFWTSWMVSKTCADDDDDDDDGVTGILAGGLLTWLVPQAWAALWADLFSSPQTSVWYSLLHVWKSSAGLVTECKCLWNKCILKWSFRPIKSLDELSQLFCHHVDLQRVGLCAPRGDKNLQKLCCSPTVSPCLPAG